MQKADQANAASSALESIFEEHGDKSDEFVLSQGQVILKGKDKKLQELYSSLRTLKPENKQQIINEIKKVREDNSQELFDINTGNLTKYDKLPEESKKQYDNIVEKAEEKASTTEIDQLNKELTNSYSNLVGISKRISSSEFSLYGSPSESCSRRSKPQQPNSKHAYGSRIFKCYISTG